VYAATAPRLSAVLRDLSEALGSETDPDDPSYFAKPTGTGAENYFDADGTASDVWGSFEVLTRYDATCGPPTPRRRRASSRRTSVTTSRTAQGWSGWSGCGLPMIGVCHRRRPGRTVRDAGPGGGGPSGPRNQPHTAALTVLRDRAAS
jgi:hypothetical protein